MASDAAAALASTLEHQQHSLTIYRKLSGRYGQAQTLRDLGDTLLEMGHQQQARQVCQEALELFEALEVPEADEVRNQLDDLADHADGRTTT